MSDVISINHGNVFGTGSWYTFHCPKCNSQVSGRVSTCNCGQLLKWKDVATEGKKDD